MSHVSVVVPNSVELINLQPTEISPLISKCQIKVCYVGDEPNRNKSIITKEVARDMAYSLRGCPIVGFYDEGTGDFDGHNKIIDISNGKFKIKDITKPYGFVDINADVWFQKFIDDDIEHEYLMTEGYIWTGQYEEAQRVVTKGNNQSMELDEKTLDAYWTKDVNEKPQFFIINEAIIKNLCILGEDVEPCFEGASITQVQFSFDNEMKDTLYNFVEQMKEILNGGNAPMYNTYAVEIGDALWEALYDYIAKRYIDPEDRWSSLYRIEGIYEEEGQKFAILQCRKSGAYYRLNFQLTEENGFVPEDELVEVSKTYIPLESPQFALEDVEAYAAKKKKEAEEEEEGKEKKPKDPNEDEEFDCGKKKKKSYELEEIEEYVELKTKFEEATASIEQLTASLNEANESFKQAQETINGLNKTIDTLNQFKLNVERKEKETMINETFALLDDEYKKDVVENIDKYSLDEIEAKLSVICVRNKINFSLETEQTSAQTTYTLTPEVDDNDLVPAWVRAARNVEKNLNK